MASHLTSLLFLVVLMGASAIPLGRKQQQQQQQRARAEQVFDSTDGASHLRGLLEIVKTQEDFATCQECDEQEILDLTSKNRMKILNNFLQRAVEQDLSDAEAREQIFPLVAALAPSLISAGVKHGPSILRGIGRGIGSFFG